MGRAHPPGVFVLTPSGHLDYSERIPMSGKRRFPLINNEIYHVFNKTIGGEDFLSNPSNLKRAIELLEFYRSPQQKRYSKFKMLSLEEKNNYLKTMDTSFPLVEIYAFAFMPNHYHFLLRQLVEKGISTFLSNFQNSYAKFYNTKYGRLGSMFLKSFRSLRIPNDEIFLHLSRYIHLNPVTSSLIAFQELKSYPWNSFRCYVSNDKSLAVNTKVILTLVGTADKYEKFVKNQVGYQKSLKRIKDYIFNI